MIFGTTRVKTSGTLFVPVSYARSVAVTTSLSVATYHMFFVFNRIVGTKYQLLIAR